MRKIVLGSIIKEIVEKTTVNNQHPVLTSSQNGLVSQGEYFNKQIASQDNTGYKIIRKGQFTYRAMSDTGRFYINQSSYDIGIVSPAYPVFEITNTDVVLPEYIAMYFKSESFQNAIALQSTGSTRVSLKLNKIKDLEIIIPDVAQQKEILRNITEAESLLVARREQLVKLDELVKSRFIELFGDKGYPEDTLLNLCNIIDYRGKTPEKVEYGLPFITAKNVRMHQMNLEPREYISKETYDKVMVRGFPKEGDVVFTTEAPLGNVCRIPHFDTEFYIGQRIVTLQTEKLEPIYLEYALSSDDFKTKYMGKSSGSTVTGIRVRLLEQLTIPVPPRELQEQFAAFVEQTDKSKLAIQQSLDKMETMKKALMQKCFR